MRLIDADKLKQHYGYWRAYHYMDEGGESIADIFDGIIDQQPTVDVRENVKGEWIDGYAHHKITDNVKEARQCSVCGACYLRKYGQGDGFDEVAPNFCPNCGADMRGES